MTYFYEMRLISLLFICFSIFATGQSVDKPARNKKEIGQQTLAFDIGLFLDKSIIMHSTGSHGFFVGVEKKRQRLVVGPTFGKNIFYFEPDEKYGLTGFMADYSIIVFSPIKQLEFAVFTQFQYNYQEKDVYYEPPSETLIMSSRYRESMYSLVGLEFRGNVFKNFQFFCKLSMGIERRVTQTHYPYYPPYNKHKKKMWVAGFRMIGINYGIPTKKKSPKQ